MSDVLVDTNVLSEIGKPRPDPAVVRWLKERDGLAISVVTLEELVFG